MRTRSQARISVPEPPVRQPSVESSNLEKPDNPPIVTMDDNRTMAQLLEAPTEGYEDAIVVPEITANNFEIKHGLLNLVQNKQFFGHDKEDPHAHIRYFNKITSTMKFPNVPRWDDTKELVKPVKAITTPQGITKTPDLRLLELEDHINFLLKGSRSAPLSSSTHNPQAYVNGTTWQHTSKEWKDLRTSFLKQRKEIIGRMTKMFGLLKELTTSETPEKVLIREEAKFPITKNVNSISLAREEEEMSDKTDVTPENTEMPTEIKIPVKEVEMNNEAECEPIKMAKEEEMTEVSSSHPVEYYLKHVINKKLIEGLVDNHRFNDFLSIARAGKTKRKTYNISLKGPVYDAILKKMITRKEDIGGNFKIPCNIGGQKGINALVDQGSNMNVMPYTTYMKLTDERPAETDIRLSLASHSYIYHLGIADDVLVDIVEHVYPVDFVILDIKEDEKRPFILGTSFLTMAKVIIKFDKGTINLRSGKSKISFHRIPESSCKIEKGVKNDIDVTPQEFPNITPPDTYFVQGPFGGVTDWYQEPASASPNYSPASDSESDPSEDPSSDHIPPLPAISPFLSSADDTTDSDTPDTPPSPTHGTPFTEITSSTQRSPVIPHDSAQDSSSDSSSEAITDFHSNASSDSSSRHSLSDHSSPNLPSTSARPSRKRRRSPMTYVPALPPVAGALSPIHANLIPSPKRIRSPDVLVRGTDIEVDDDVERSDGLDINPVEAVIEACFGFAEYIRTSGVDDDGDTPPVVSEEIPEPAQEGAAGVIEGVQREQGHRIVRVESTVTALTEVISHHLEISSSVTLCCRKMPNTRSEASMTHEEVEELVTRRVAEEMEAREAARTLESLNKNGDEQKGENGRNGNGENRNGNRNGNHGTECVVGLTGWFEKMETVFNISNCPLKYQVKYATFTLQDSALTWWNSHKRTIGVDAAYAMKCVGLMKLMIEVYCPRNEIQKMETKLWNLTVKGTTC
ncbi:reverse transcriptase domain-containing protein [Tanacetum coccineum]